MWAIVAYNCGHPNNRYNQCIVNAQTHFDLILEMEKILTSNFLSQFLQFSQQLPTKEKLLKAPKYLGT
jgi:hypothetical protein